MDIEKIKTQMCDNYCKHFAEIRATFEDIDRGQEELDRICEHCPLNELEEVEVVRCRDCMWNYIHVTPKGHDYHICRLLNLAFDNDDDFFCAYGEKRNECGEPIPHWRGQMDGCLPFQTEVDDEQIH